MAYGYITPHRIRLEDETTGTGYLFIQKDGEFLWCDASANILQVLSCVKFGTLADRPTAGKKGRLYFTTDTKELFYDNGSSWVRVVSGVTGLYDADRDTYVEVEKSADEDAIRGYVANTEAFKIDSAGIVTFAKQSCCVAYLSSDQNVSAGVVTKINFDAVTIDTQNEFDSTNSRITVMQPGKYCIVLHLRIIPGAAGDWIASYLRVNGVTKGKSYMQAVESQEHTLTITRILHLSQGDYVEGYILNSNSDMKIWGDEQATYLTVAKIS